MVCGVVVCHKCVFVAHDISIICLHAIVRSSMLPWSGVSWFLTLLVGCVLMRAVIVVVCCGGVLWWGVVVVCHKCVFVGP